MKLKLHNLNVRKYANKNKWNIGMSQARMPAFFDSKSRPCRKNWNWHRMVGKATVTHSIERTSHSHVQSVQAMEHKWLHPCDYMILYVHHSSVVETREAIDHANSLCPYFMLHRSFQRHPKARTGQSLVVGSTQSSWCQAIAPILRGFYMWFMWFVFLCIFLGYSINTAQRVAQSRGTNFRTPEWFWIQDITVIWSTLHISW